MKIRKENAEELNKKINKELCNNTNKFSDNCYCYINNIKCSNIQWERDNKKRKIRGIKNKHVINSSKGKRVC